MDRNYMQLCRLCLSGDGYRVPIFDEQGETFQKISTCLSVKVASDDSLPKNICIKCYSKLDTCYEFRNTSTNSEKQLLTWLRATASIEAAAKAAKAKETNDVNKADTEISTNAQTYLIDRQQLGGFQDEFEDNPGEAGGAADDDDDYDEEDDEPLAKRARRRTSIDKGLAVPNVEEETIEPQKVHKTEEVKDENEPANVEQIFVDVAEEDQPGPSGIGELGTEALLVIKDRTLDKDYDEEQSSSEEEGELLSALNDDSMDKNFDDDDPSSREEESELAPNNVPMATNINMRPGPSHLHPQPNQQYPNMSPNFQPQNNVSHLNANAFQPGPPPLIQLNPNMSYNRYPGAEKNSPLSAISIMEIASHEEHSCLVCLQTFRDLTDSKSHIKEHKIEELFFRKNKLFRKLTDYTLNLTKDTYKCQLCNAILLNRKVVICHYSQHLGAFDVFLDSTMNRKFKRLLVILDDIPDELEKEMNSLEKRRQSKMRTLYNIEGERQIPCCMCNYIFRTQKKFCTHVGMTHKKRTVCEICGKVLANNYNFTLTSHMNMHSVNKEFTCDECGKAFTDQMLLTDHVRTHTGENPYNCVFCDRSFRLYTTLSKHTRTHTGR